MQGPARSARSQAVARIRERFDTRREPFVATGPRRVRSRTATVHPRSSRPRDIPEIAIEGLLVSSLPPFCRSGNAESIPKHVACGVEPRANRSDRDAERGCGLIVRPPFDAAHDKHLSELGFQLREGRAKPRE